jgi:carbon dioxide concentrating mechanism protein CcmL
MRIGIVRGHVTLNSALPAMKGKALVILEPITMTNLTAKNGFGGGKSLVAVDGLGAAKGQMVGFTEGREAANPFWPTHVPVDAYCTLIIDSITTSSTQQQKFEVQK